MFERVTILPQEVLIDEFPLSRLYDLEAFLAAFAQPSRQRDIPMHPSGVRVEFVWDALGMVAYADLPEKRMSHLYIALSCEHTPGNPQVASAARMTLNGGLIDAETTERTLPRTGSTPIIEKYRSFSYECPHYILHLGFDRRLNRLHRKSGAPRLSYISFSWPDRSPIEK